MVDGHVSTASGTIEMTNVHRHILSKTAVVVLRALRRGNRSLSEFYEVGESNSNSLANCTTMTIINRRVEGRGFDPWPLIRGQLEALVMAFIEEQKYSGDPVCFPGQQFAS